MKASLPTLDARDTNFIIEAGAVDNIFAEADGFAHIAAKSVKFTDTNKNYIELSVARSKLDAVIRQGGIPHVPLSIFPTDYIQYKVAVETVTAEDVDTVAKWIDNKAKDIFLTSRKEPSADVVKRLYEMRLKMNFIWGF